MAYGPEDERRTVERAKRDTARVRSAAPHQRQQERKRKRQAKRLHAKAQRNANRRALERAIEELE